MGKEEQRKSEQIGQIRNKYMDANVKEKKIYQQLSVNEPKTNQKAEVVRLDKKAITTMSYLYVVHFKYKGTNTWRIER